MYYNPETDRALRTIDQLAEENRKIIMKLPPVTPKKIIWDSNQGRWLNAPPDQ